jgi:hypothetical protein
MTTYGYPEEVPDHDLLRPATALSRLGPPVGARLRARLDAARTAARARAAAQHSLPLVGAEHSLVVVCADGGRWMAGTDRALYHSRRELSRAPTTAEWVRLGWEEIAGLAWDADAGVVTVTGLLPTVPPRTVVPLSVKPALGETLAGLARERISSTEVVRTRFGPRPARGGSRRRAQGAGNRRAGLAGGSSSRVL